MTDAAATTSHLVMLSGFGTPGGQFLAPVYLTSNATATSSTTCTTITDGTHPMQWNIGAGKNYRLTCEVPVNFATNAKVGFCLAGPGTPTHLTLDAYGLIGTGAVYADINFFGATYGAGSQTTLSGAPGTNVNEVVHVTADIQNVTASGAALALQTVGNGTANYQVLQDATCDLKPTN
jgi:hypothetical protein